jgi:hypothetical protein
MVSVALDRPVTRRLAVRIGRAVTEQVGDHTDQDNDDEPKPNFLQLFVFVIHASLARSLDLGTQERLAALPAFRLTGRSP